MAKLLLLRLAYAKRLAVVVIQLVDGHPIETVVYVARELHRLPDLLRVVLPHLPVHVVDRK